MKKLLNDPDERKKFNVSNGVLQDLWDILWIEVQDVRKKEQRETQGKPRSNWEQKRRRFYERNGYSSEEVENKRRQGQSEETIEHIVEACSRPNGNPRRSEVLEDTEGGLQWMMETGRRRR
ncbi:hypothetical protein CBL_13768 [Carabus blaptoides fortunei]